MKKYICISLLGLANLLPVVAYAAPQIYGQVWLSSSGAPARGAIVQVNCGNNNIPVPVDSSGQYRTPPLPNNATCQVSVSYDDKQSLPLKVRVSGSDVRLNLELARWKNDQWLLHRR